jgi:hypothetical protein
VNEDEFVDIAFAAIRPWVTNDNIADVIADDVWKALCAAGRVL